MVDCHGFRAPAPGRAGAPKPPHKYQQLACWPAGPRDRRNRNLHLIPQSLRELSQYRRGDIAHRKRLHQHAELCHESIDWPPERDSEPERLS